MIGQQFWRPSQTVDKILPAPAPLIGWRNFIGIKIQVGLRMWRYQLFGGWTLVCISCCVLLMIRSDHRNGFLQNSSALLFIDTPLLEIVHGSRTLPNFVKIFVLFPIPINHHSPPLSSRSSLFRWHCEYIEATLCHNSKPPPPPCSSPCFHPHPPSIPPPYDDPDHCSDDTPAHWGCIVSSTISKFQVLLILLMMIIIIVQTTPQYIEATLCGCTVYMSISVSSLFISLFSH